MPAIPLDWRERTWVAWPKLLGLFVFALALWAQSGAMVGVFYDDGIYVVLAKALAEGEGFRNIHLPGAPAAVHYPFLYPAALSLLWRLWPAFPDNVALFQIFDSGALALAAWAIATHTRRWAVPRAVVYVALPMGFAAFPLLTVVGVRFSEPLFLALAASAILFADRERVSIPVALAAGALAGLAALTRTAGVAIVIGIALAFWLRTERRSAVVSAGVGIALLLPWALWLVLHAGNLDPRLSANYGTYLSEAWQAGLGGFVEGLGFGVIVPFARLVLPNMTPWLWYPLAGLLMAAVVTGGVVTAHRAPALVASLALYLITVALWPYAPDRFIWIVVPWLALLGTAGATAAWRRSRVLRVGVMVLALAVAAGYLPREYRSLSHRGFTRAAEGITARFNLLVPGTRHATPDGAVVAVEDEALMYLYTGRHSVPNHLFHWRGRTTDPLSPDAMLSFFCDSGVTHLALTGPRAEAARLAGGLDPLFIVTEGPALYRFQCPAPAPA